MVGENHRDGFHPTLRHEHPSIGQIRADFLVGASHEIVLHCTVNAGENLGHGRGWTLEVPHQGEIEAALAFIIEKSEGGWAKLDNICHIYTRGR